MKKLRNCPLFDSLSDEELKRVKDQGENISLSEGEVLFELNDVGEELYVILEGLLQISIPDTYSDRQKALALLGSGEFVGEMAILTENDRSGRVEALEETTLFRLDGEVFRDLLVEIPQIALNLSSTLCERLGRTDQEVKSMAFKNVTQRVAEQLLKLADLFGKGDEGEVGFEMTHQKLADLVGSHRETVSRHLSDLEEKDIITADEGKLYVNNRERLEQMT
ncbi:MAG: Crp/Fnr family transcriptional regulator [bacterium]